MDRLATLGGKCAMVTELTGCQCAMNIVSMLLIPTVQNVNGVLRANYGEHTLQP